jgi:predicted ABC-type ATPase
MIDVSAFNTRPIIVAIAGSNGAGKTTFYHSFLASAGLRFINADVLALQLGMDPYEAARLADGLRRQLVANRESFVFETVFSDPVGEKIAFLEGAVQNGYSVVVCFIGLDCAQTSMERVAMRVSQGGHDIPDEKLQSRFPRTLSNLRSAIARLPHVLIYDNSDLAHPYRLIVAFDHAQPAYASDTIPDWLLPVISSAGESS